MNDQQAAANQAAELAIGQMAEAYDLLDVDFVVTSWMLVLASEHADQPGVTGYARAFSGGHMADHHALGLLTIAMDQILNGDDDERGDF